MPVAANEPRKPWDQAKLPNPDGLMGACRGTFELLGLIPQPVTVEYISVDTVMHAYCCIPVQNPVWKRPGLSTSKGNFAWTKKGEYCIYSETERSVVRSSSAGAFEGACS